MTKRFIQVDDIPSSLWCKKSEHIILPEKLVDLWKGLLEKNHLMGLAKTIATKGFEGGLSKEDTDKHLAWRYNGSCARVLLSLLDPNEGLPDVSDAYASIFAGDKVFLVDIPSGSGAASISILCTLFELRKHNVLPRQPLYVTIVAGEISQAARDYFREQLDNLALTLPEQSIWINHEIVEWDTLSKISTVNLIRKITILSQYATAKLLILSNFSGFLESSGHWNNAKDQLDDIFLYSRDTLSAAIWIEPQKNNVKTLFKKIIESVKKSISSLFGKKYATEDAHWYAQANINCKQPIKEGTFPVRLTVMRFDLPMEIENE